PNASATLTPDIPGIELQEGCQRCTGVVTPGTRFALSASGGQLGINGIYYRFWAATDTPPAFTFSGGDFAEFGISGALDQYYYVEYYAVDNAGQASFPHREFVGLLTAYAKALQICKLGERIQSLSDQIIATHLPDRSPKPFLTILSLASKSIE